jgi:hypothetical protein
MKPIKDLNGYCDAAKISPSEHGQRNLFTLTNVSWMRFLKDNFSKEELMQAANEMHKEEKVKDFSFHEAPLFFEPVIDSPLPTHSFTIKDEEL